MFLPRSSGKYPSGPGRYKIAPLSYHDSATRETKSYQNGQGLFVCPNGFSSGIPFQPFLLEDIFHFPVRPLVKECPHTFAVFVVTCDLKAFHDTNTPRTMTIGSFKKENLLHKLVLSGTSTCRTYSVGGSDEKLF